MDRPTGIPTQLCGSAFLGIPGQGKRHQSNLIPHAPVPTVLIAQDRPVVAVETLKQVMKPYTVSIELDTVEVRVYAKNKRDAKKKALAKLNRKKPTSMIRKSWPGNNREIDVECHE